MADWTGAQLAALRRMWMDGATAEAISEATGRSVVAVHDQRRRLGLPPRRAVAVEGLPTHVLPAGVIVHVGGIPYRYLGRGRVEGATPLETALSLSDGRAPGARAAQEAGAGPRLPGQDSFPEGPSL